MEDTIRLFLMYAVVPVWLLAGLADWFCHRATHIETTAGPKESWLHILMFAEMGVPVLAGLFLDITATVLLVMLMAFLLHEATAYWDVQYAASHRHVSALEQRIHSYLELMPLLALSLISVQHADQWLALLGQAPGLDFGLRLKNPPLPAAYLTTLMAAIALTIVLPYGEELLRTLRARRQARLRSGAQPSRPAAWP